MPAHPANSTRHPRRHWLTLRSSPYRTLLDIICLSSQTARTPGDALRELDSMGVSWRDVIDSARPHSATDTQVLNGDNPFILVHSPLVSNYDLSRMVDAHKKLREKDPNYIMTMGVGKGGRCVGRAVPHYNTTECRDDIG
jgi:translation initiation factor eIF-2B subunit epsilon